MNARLARLLEPAKTPSSDRWAFKWSDRRSKGSQIAGGFRIAGGFIAGFVVIVCGLGGLAGVNGMSNRSVLFSWIAFMSAVIIMLCTANRWTPYVAGFFFGPAVLKVLGMLLVGDDAYYSAHSITRGEMAEFLAYCVAVVGLTSRFIGKRPAPTTVVDRIALTLFVFSSFEQVVIPYRFPPWPLLFGLTALFAAWCAHRFPQKSRKQHRRTRHDDVARVSHRP